MRPVVDRFEAIDDTQLVRFAILGSLDAYDALVRRYRPAVLLVARQELGCAGLAEDAAQDAFLMAFRALPRLREPERFPGWLGAIVRNRARRMSRANGRAVTMAPTDLDAAVLAHSRELSAQPVDDLVRGETRRLALAALEALPPDHRAVLWLHYLEDWPVARIADFLSLPVTTVKWRMHRGRELLRRRLTDHEENVDE